MKKLILVNPTYGGGLSGLLGRFLKFGYAPILSILEAMSPQDYEIITYHNPFFIKYEKGLVGITCFTSNAYRAYKYADKFRKKGAKVIMGGCHVMFNTEEALQHCDSVIVGEVESIWREILDDYENGKLEKIYHGKAEDDFSQYYHEGLLKLEGKKLQTAIQMTRGCSFRCKFCAIPKLYPGKVRRVPVHRVIEEVRAAQKKGIRFIQFNENNIFADPAYAKKIFKALIPLKIRWGALCSINIAKDTQALDLAKKSGCYQLQIGFETINKQVIKNNPGKLNYCDEYLRLINRIKKRKIKITGTFIVGFDEDTYYSIWKLLVFIFKANLNLSLFSVLTPIPGSELFDTYKKEKRITTYNWRKYNAFHVIIKPKRINHYILKFIFPFIRVSFLLTTNIGRILLLIVILTWIFL